MSNIFKRVPPFARVVLAFFCSLWGIMLVARAIMLALVWTQLRAANVPMGDILEALYIGAKFDARIAVLLCIPAGLVLAWPVKKALHGWRVALSTLYGCLVAGLLTTYCVDFGYYFYLHQRLDATVFDFLNDASISFSMVWQSYPVGSIGAVVLVLAILFARWCNRLLLRYNRLLYEERMRPENLLRVGTPSIKPRVAWICALFFGLGLMAYGQISSNLFPLRWSNAYFSPNRDVVILALNPLQNLRDTLRSLLVTPPNTAAVRAGYNDMAAWLRVDNPNTETLDFWRTVHATPQDTPWNVVLIVMESLSWPMTSFAPGNDDPTPNLRALAQDGLLFSQFFSPARTTARAIFTTMTGIPDVNRGGGTTSRNPRLVDQFLPISEFKGYEKRYLIGGSASWANIRGLLTHNVDDLQLMEEGDWKAPNVDVWGISDLDLFRESIGVFNTLKQPFVAVVQTAGFHRPYTIPSDNAGFKNLEPTEAALRNYGFESIDEFNSMRFADHALGEFFQMASKEPWFSNTIFAIVGDHGLNNPPANMSPGYVACGLQDSHVPLVLYAPGLIEPGVLDFPSGQPDIFPTVAALAGISIRNHGLGRNLLDPDTPRDARQFIAESNEDFRRLVKNGYCYQKRTTEVLYDLAAPELKNLLDSEPELAQTMRNEADHMFHTSKYLIFNNSRSRIPQ